MNNVALFLRVLGAMLFVAGIVLAGVAFEVARRRERPSEIALLLGLTRIGVLLVAAGDMLLSVFGLWLVHLARFGLGSGWVDTPIALYILALGLGGLGGQKPRHARQLATKLAAEQAPINDEPRELIENRRSRAANYARQPAHRRHPRTDGLQAIDASERAHAQTRASCAHLDQ